MPHAGQVTLDLAAASHTAPNSLARLRADFDGGRGYLAACTVGVTPRSAREAIVADAHASSAGRADPVGYSALVESSRQHFARLVRVAPERVAIGSQTSVLAALIAASVPDGAEVLCAEGDFSSMTLPFVHAGRGIRVRTAPLADLADAITAQTWLVAFSIVQSATGEVADAAAITAAAARTGARTFCDATQAVGWLPVDAGAFDALVCHTYKWLCTPRGVAFLTVSADFQPLVPTIFAGWYAGVDPWTSCYGHAVPLATDASRLDVSPAWQAFVGAEPALALFADTDPASLYTYATHLAASFRARLSLPAPPRASAIVTWDDDTGCDLARLTLVGITASGRAGRARVAFHVFNDVADVHAAADALGY